MAGSAAAEQGGVFISYRRQEADYVAGRLFDRLVDRFGEDQVFMDVDSIEPGSDFAETIEQAVGACDVLLALIGRQWLTMTGEDGNRRLDDPNDIVRLEIEAALGRDVRVIPVLMDGASMPRSGELPASLAKLARRQALGIRHESFRADASRLVEIIERILQAAPRPASPPGPTGMPPPDRTQPEETQPAVAGQDEGSAEARGTEGVEQLAVPRAIQVLRHDHASIDGIAFSPDGRLLATASSDHTARIWEVAGGQERARVRHDNNVYGVAFSPDGQLLATAGDRTARVWEVAGGRKRVRISHDDKVFGVAFSPDGRLATASWDGTARVWQVPGRPERAIVWEFLGGKERARARVTHEPAMYGVTFSPDGRLLATAGADGTARIWEVAGGQERARVNHGGNVYGVAFSPDGRLLATAGYDGTARVWELANGQERIRVTHDSSVHGVAFSPDGRLLATASNDHTARVWELANGQERIRVTHDSSVHGVAFSPDGRLLATASWDGTARVWALFEPASA